MCVLALLLLNRLLHRAWTGARGNRPADLLALIFTLRLARSHWLYLAAHCPIQFGAALVGLLY
jgi:hypothetical protein